MDAWTTTAARALVAGEPLKALKQVALRDDPDALALRGIAMAQLGDFARAKGLLRRAARAFGPGQATARARCIVAEAEMALVSRDLAATLRMLEPARALLEAGGDRVNAAHAGYLQARCLLLVGRLDECRRELDAVDVEWLSPASRVGYWLVVAGEAMRRIRAMEARDALNRAVRAAHAMPIAALATEVMHALAVLDGPAARCITRDGESLLGLGEVEAQIASNTLLVDACRDLVRRKDTVVRLARRPVLFTLVRVIAEAWPDDVSRETLIARAFRVRRHVDDSHRARLRVEIGRLRKLLAPLAGVQATPRGFVLKPSGKTGVAVLAPPVEGRHARLLSLLADNAAWSSSALALALDVSPRTVQRALDALAQAGKVESFGRGRARRWVAVNVPGFPTTLLLPGSLLHA